MYYDEYKCYVNSAIKVQCSPKNYDITSSDLYYGWKIRLSIERTTPVVVGAVTYWFEDQTLGREDYTSCSGSGDVLVRRSDSRLRGLHQL